MISNDFCHKFITESNAIESIFDGPGTPYYDQHEYALKIAIQTAKVAKTIDICHDWVTNIHSHLMRDLMPEDHRPFSGGKQFPAGEYRDFPLRLGGSRAPAPLPEFVVPLMDVVIGKALQARTTQDIWAVHYAFEVVHPFPDGNGRTGRLLLAYLAEREKLPIPIVPYKKRFEYYDDIETWRSEFGKDFFGGPV